MKNNEKNNTRVTVNNAELQEQQMHALWNGAETKNSVSNYERIVATGLYGVVI